MASGIITPGPGAEQLTSAFAHIKSSAANATSYFHPSSKDLLMVFPRMVSRAGSFAFVTLPELFEGFVSGGNGGRIIAEATGDGSQAVIATNAGYVTERLMAVRGANDVPGSGGYAASFNQAFSIQNVRTFGGVSLKPFCTNWN
jgi:hypothetical protein